MLKSSRNGSMRSGCCPTNTFVTAKCEFFINCWITGDSLITSGRVPKKKNTLFMNGNPAFVSVCLSGEEIFNLGILKCRKHSYATGLKYSKMIE